MKGIESIENKEVFPDEGEEIIKSENGIDIKIVWKKFPSQEKGGGHLSLYLPGWEMDTSSSSTSNLCESLSKYADTMSIKSEVLDKDLHNASNNNVFLLYERATAIVHFVESHKLNVDVVVGHSQGGNEAITITNKLQSRTDIRGLVLIASTGLYKTGSSNLILNFIRGMTYDPLTTEGESSIGDTLRPLYETAENIKNDIVRFGIMEYTKRLLRQVQEMRRKNWRTQSIKVPVIIIFGSNDKVTDPSVLLKGKGDIISNEDYVRRELFPKSPYLKFLLDSEDGHHYMHSLKPDHVASSIEDLLDRYYRKNEE